MCYRGIYVDRIQYIVVPCPVQLLNLFRESLIKSFDKLMTNCKILILFVVSHELVEWSNHDRNQLVQRSLSIKHVIFQIKFEVNTINSLNKILLSAAGMEVLVLRLLIGFILTAHGSQKLLGWFDGYGLEGAGQFMDSLGLQPGF